MYIACIQVKGTIMKRWKIALVLLCVMPHLAQCKPAVSQRKPVAARGMLARARDAVLRTWARVTSVRNASMS